MSDVKRVLATDIKKSVEDGITLLVCAYDDDAKFNNFRLEGAIPLSAFKPMVKGMVKERPIVFYCA